MNPSTPKTKTPPSTQLRKAVSGGSRQIFWVGLLMGSLLALTACVATATQNPLEFARAKIGQAVLASSYQAGDKYVLGLAIGNKTTGAGTMYGASVDLWIDLDDYFAVAAEGQGVDPWVTIWVTIDFATGLWKGADELGPLGLSLVQLKGFCTNPDFGDKDIIGDFGQLYDQFRFVQKFIDVTYDGSAGFYWFFDAKTIDFKTWVGLRGGYKAQLLKADIKKTALDNYLSSAIGVARQPGVLQIPFGPFGDTFAGAGFFQAIAQPGAMRVGLAACSDRGAGSLANGIAGFKPYHIPFPLDVHYFDVIVQNANQGIVGANFKLEAHGPAGFTPEPYQEYTNFETFWLGSQDAASRIWMVSFENGHPNEGDVVFTLSVQDILGNWHQVDQKTYHITAAPDTGQIDATVTVSCTQTTPSTYGLTIGTSQDDTTCVGAHVAIAGGTLAGVSAPSGFSVNYYDAQGNLVDLTSNPTICELVTGGDAGPFPAGFSATATVSVNWNYAAPQKEIRYRAWAIDADTYSRDFGTANMLLRIARDPYNSVTAPDYSKHIYDANFRFTNYATRVLSVSVGKPLAGIQSISPSSVTRGSGNVLFNGGTSSATTPGATLTTYRWNSSINGQLYSGANSSFSKDSTTLSAGQHTITLQVQDSNGLWSENTAQAALSVYEPGPDKGHDLAVNRIDLDTTIIPVNGTVRTDVFIENQGTNTESGFSILYSLKNSSGGILNQKTNYPAGSWSPGQNKGPGYVYLTSSGGYSGPATVEVTVQNALDEDRSDNTKTAGLYVGAPPTYDGYFGASWTEVPGTGYPTEGGYTVKTLTDSGSSVGIQISKGASTWNASLASGQFTFCDANKCAVRYLGKDTSGGKTKYGYTILANNTSAAWLTVKNVTVTETDTAQFTLNQADPNSTYCSGWNIATTGDGATVATWNEQRQRIDGYTYRETVTPTLNTAGHYEFWFVNCFGFIISTTTTVRNGNSMAIRAALTVNEDREPETAITSCPTGTNATRTITAQFTGTDDRTPTTNLTFSYRLTGYQDSWSSFSSGTSVTFSSLTNGTYGFEVKAKDNQGQVDQTPAQRTFTVYVQNLLGTPNNTAPTHGAMLRPTQPVILQGSVFSDSDAGASHSASEFHARTDAGNYTSPAWTSGVVSGTTSYPIPPGTLPAGVKYWWQCRYRDNTSRWSEWSGETSFTMQTNHAPNASPVFVEVIHDRACTFQLPVSDEDGDSMFCQIVTAPGHGSVVTNTPTSVIYTPASNFVGSDSFTFKASDGLAVSLTKTATVSIVNHVPGANSLLAVVESGKRTPLTLPAFDSDADSLTYSITANPTNGTLYTANLPSGSVDYQSTTGFIGSVSIGYSVSDGLASASGALTLIVSAPQKMTIGVLLDAIGRAVIQYPTIAGYTYKVQYCDGLTNQWNDLFTGTVGDGTLKSTVDTNQPLPKARFYRGVLLLP